RGIQTHTGNGYAERLNQVSSLLIATKLERMVVSPRRGQIVAPLSGYGFDTGGR
ncbi:hypothetical protein SAMN05443574_1431, partial [Haloarcula vallismortis]